MYLERAYRQVALVSYGNEFLSGSVDSEILDRHPLLFTHFPILRDLDTGTLLAGSASHLLNHLKTQGLFKISLHLASDVLEDITESKIFDLKTTENDFCIVCHFPNQIFKVLIYAEEEPLWQEYDENGFPQQSNYNNYHDSVENYVLMDISHDYSDKILADLQAFSWQSFYDDYQNSIYAFEISKRYGTFPVPLTESNCYEGNYYQKQEQFPLLPFSLKRNYASNLIINAAALTHAFHVESHAKNEYAAYWHMSENERKEFSKASQTLDELFPILLKHSANHHQEVVLNSQTQRFTPLITPPTIIAKSQDDSAHDSNITNTEHIALDETPSAFHWVGLIKFLWFMLWCYCALWTLAYFTVHWGNIFIIIIALFYALYKALKIKDDQSI
ncbi:hypothetical protein ACDW34_14690 [Acinetobacter piscicola]|uniref:hypothetical protein n=1 Tax=Acinetobacter piscicola TaxID=2006115 RepID=UPI003558BF4C